ncbi:MAG: hypothetical protein NC543_09510 [bacterium]|nr:hypothetical protein [bacterium]
MKLKEALSFIRRAMAEIEVETSKSGLPCLWESGGSWTNTGSSWIICDRFGNQKRAIFVPNRGDLCNGLHALIPVTVGDMVIDDNQHRGHHQVSVWEITKIEDGKATLQLLEYVDNAKIDEQPIYSDAVTAAMEKACHYHCRSVYYARY